MELDEYSLHYERFITHLKFFVQRVFSGMEINDDEKSFLLMLKEQYPNEYRCALKVRDYMRKEFGQDLSEDLSDHPHSSGDDKILIPAGIA